MLRLMLTCHRNIVVPPEAGFAAWLHERHHAWAAGNEEQIDAFVQDVFRTRKIETWDLDEPELRRVLQENKPATYPEAVSLVYETYGRRAGRSFTRWGDKNNFYIDYIDTLDAMFPDAQFVHIVRDGRNVACSYRSLAAQKIDSTYAPRLPVEIDAIAREWQRNTETVHRAFGRLGPGRAREVRMEDLVSAPESSLRSLCGFLSEEFDPNMLEYHRLGADLEPREFHQWKERTLSPPSPARNEIYRRELEAGALEAFEAVAGEALRRYGYLQ